jgi:DNA-binding CsgD family transcriptional regulator/tetratricopeptide (TPR) repeat protein
MPTPVSSPVFVGRDAELAALEGGLDRAESGEGAAFLVAGESGIGKSRLLGELSDRARSRGVTVLTGECLEMAGGELPYAALVGALRSLVRERGREAAAELAAGRPELGRLMPELGPADAATTEAEGAQARLFEQLLGALSELAAETPVLLAIEDLQWADRSTRDFVGFLVRSARRERIALVATYRSDEVGRRHPLRPFVLELERSGGARRLDLRPFDRRELARQLEGIAGAAAEPALVDRLLERSDGNPFFAEELLAAAGADALPESLRDALLLRVEALSAPAQALLRTAAVAGRKIDHGLLEAVTGLAVEELNLALRETLGAYILVHDPASSGYSFRHALLREAVYEDLLPGERRLLHVALAEALTARPELGGTRAGAAAELAYHWHAAHELPRALSASVAAGIGAEAVRALAEAALHYGNALEIWDVAADAADLPLDRLELIRRSAEAENLAGDPERAIALVRNALAELDESADPVAAALLHERLGRYVWMSGRGEEALPIYRRAVELMPVQPPSEERALVLAAEGQALMLANRFAECLAPCEEALAIAGELDFPAIEAHALNSIAATYAAGGKFDEAIAATERARELALPLGLTEEVVRSYVNGGDILEQAGRIDDSIGVAWEGVEVCAGLGVGRRSVDFLRAEVSDRLLRVGRWEEAERLLDELEQGGPTGITEGQVNLELAQLNADRGHFEEARRCSARARELIVRSGGPMWLAPLHAAEATTELWSGDPEAAAAGLQEALQLVEGAENPFYTGVLYELATRAAADIAARTPGDPAVAAEQRRRASGLVERLDRLIAPFDGNVPSRAAISRAVCGGELSRFEQSAEGAVRSEAAWEGARSVALRLGDSFRAAHAGWRQAEAVLAAGGTRGRAAELAAAAYATAIALGAHPLVAELEALARRGRLELGATAGAEAGGDAAHDELARLELTPRELEVLRYLAAGATNKQIAAALFISGKTASVHVSNILAKLGVGNRGEAGALAHRLGVTAAPAAPS